MGWFTQLSRKLDGACVTAGSKPDKQQALADFIELAMQELSAAIIEPVLGANGKREQVDAIDRITDVLIPRCCANLLWRGNPTAQSACVTKLLEIGFQHSARAHAAFLESLGTHKAALLQSLSRSRSTSPAAECLAAVLALFGPQGPLQLPRSALKNPSLVTLECIELHQHLGIDINGGSADQDKKTTLRSILSSQSFRSSPAEAEALIASWLDAGPDLSWVWHLGRDRAQARHDLPALEWAGHSKALVRHIIETALTDLKQEPFPALSINRRTAGLLPLIHYALLHGMTDLADALHNQGADPNWNGCTSVLARRTFGNAMRIGTNLASWYSTSQAKLFVQQHAEPKELDRSTTKAAVLDYTLDNWPADWQPDHDGTLIFAAGHPALCGPIRPANGLSAAFLLKHGLASLSPSLASHADIFVGACLKLSAPLTSQLKRRRANPPATTSHGATPLRA